MQQRIRLMSLPIMSMFTCLVLLIATSAWAVGPPVFINEIHYDNTGSDTGEAIEIAGPAGTNLTGWTVVLYNGNGGASYNTIALSGTIPNQQAGFGTLSFMQAGIQNGSPDGLALVDTGGVVVEFLSYEGSFVAVDGPANGMLSSDIGVSEASGTAVGDSLQLTGTGTMGGDFAWAPSQPNTFGAVNTTQAFAGDGGPSDPVINEFVANHTGADTEAFVEVLGDPSTDYSDFTVLEIDGDSSGPGVIDAVLPVGSTDAGGYWIDPEDMENGTLTVLLVEDFSGSVGDDLDTNDDGTFDVTPWTQIVDDVAVTDGGSSDLTYSATVLAPFFDGNPFGAGGASRIPNGIDTDSISDWLRNDFDGFGLPGLPGSPAAGEAENTPGAANVAVRPQIDEIVINEVMQNPAAVSDNNGEWFELVNATPDPVDLNGWTIKDNGSNFHVIANGGPLVIPSGGFLVLGRDDDAGSNGGVAIDYQYSNMFLGNGSDSLILLDTASSEVDRVDWDNGATFPDPNGASMALKASALDNNVGANWCESQTPFGNGDRGTPGEPNDCFAGLVINEVDADDPGSDDEEFIELYDGGDGNTDLSGLVVVLFNGSDDASYNAFDLDGFSTDSDGFFVICGNAGNVPECDFDVSPNSNLLQNGADAVALYVGDASDFPNDTPVTTDGLLDALVYDTNDSDDPGLLALLNAAQPQVNEDGKGDKDKQSNQRCPNGFGGQRNTDKYSQDTPTAGGLNNCPPLEIFEIQGASLASVYEGFFVATDADVVTALAPDGFFMQTPSAGSDGDVDTSDGIFVFTGGAPTDDSGNPIAVGDSVDVAGRVEEFFGFTEITGSPSVTFVGSESVPAPVAFGATVPSPDSTAPSCAVEFECYEGMRVEIVDGTVTGPNQRFGADPIAEVHITAASARTFREPGIEFPGNPLFPEWDGNPEVFELDPDKLGLGNQIIPAGSSFSATGVLGYEFGGYEFWPDDLTVDPAPLPLPVRPREPGEFTVGTLNLFRLFDDVDDAPDADGRNDAVVSTADYHRRLGKFSEYIRTVLGAPDILAVQEVESLNVLGDLATQIETDNPSVVYTAMLVEGNDIGTIDVGFLVRGNITVDAVTQIDPDVTFFNPVSMADDILHDRPPLLLEGNCELQFGSFPIAVMAVHNRSLGSIDDPTQGSRVRKKRLLQAESIATAVQDLQTTDPDVRLVITGDFNAFEFTDGYVDSLGVITGDFDPATSLVCSESACAGDIVEPNLANQVLALTHDDRYSFIFRGNAQVLDHSLTSAKLADEISGIEYGRGNADAAVDLINDDGTLLRASDHDGLVLYINKDEDADGVPNDNDVCPGTVLPENVPTKKLGTNRFADTDGDGVFNTKAPKGKGPRKYFDIGDTAGCSCEQIIEAQGLGNGHTKNGCSISAMEDWTALVGP